MKILRKSINNLASRTLKKIMIWLLLLLITCCRTQAFLPKNPDDYGAVVSFKKEDGLGQYTFGYSEGHPSGATFRSESGNAFGHKKGTYGIKESNGQIRIVDYIADNLGFRANIISNEPGVAPVNPASVSINKPATLLPPAPAVPIGPVAVPPPPPPPPVAVRPNLFPPPPVSYNYISPAAVPVAVPPPQPPAYFPPRYATPLASFSAPLAPVPVGPYAKGFAAYPPPPPPPPSAYYTNFLQGKGYISAVRTYPNLLPPLSAIPPQYNYFSNKSPPLYQEFSFPL